MDASAPSNEFFFETYVREANSLRHFLEFAWFGADRVTDHADFEETYLFPKLTAFIGSPAVDKLRALLPSDDVRKFVKNQRSEGFPYLHQLSVTRLWTILESVVDDAVAHVLKCSRPADLPTTVRGIKAPIFEYLAADDDSRIQFLLDCVKQDARASLKIGVGRFESLLAAVGYGGEVNDLVRKVLLELAESRNVVVHQAGKVDSRIVGRCPWLNLVEGSQLCLTRDHVARFMSASDWYAFELLDRLLGTVENPAPPLTVLAGHRNALADHKATLLDRLRRAD